MSEHVGEKTEKRNQESGNYQADDTDDNLADHTWGGEAESDVTLDDSAESVPAGADTDKHNLAMNMAARRQIEMNRENKRLKDLTEDDLFGSYEFDLSPPRKRPVAMREKSRGGSNSRSGTLQRRSTAKVS